MGILKKLMDVLPHTEFETPELQAKHEAFMEQLDKDMDESGFDTSTTTDDYFDILKNCIEALTDTEEADIIVEYRLASEEEQEEIDKLAEELEAKEDEEDAEIVAETTVTMVEDAEEVEEAEDTITEEADEEFEEELSEEIAEQEKLEEIRKEAEGVTKSESP